MKTLTFLLAILLPSLTLADEPVRVSFAGLDLHSRAGIRALYLRIEVASKVVCGDPEQVVQIYARERIATCVRKTMAATVERVNNARLSAYAASR